jgi:hypothetical protein
MALAMVALMFGMVVVPPETEKGAAYQRQMSNE